METTNDNSRNPRTFVIGAVAGIVLATALGAAFLLGGQAGGSGSKAEGKELAQATPTSQTAAQGSTSSAQPQQPTGDAPQNDDDSEQPQAQDEAPVATETPAVAEEEDPTETPSSTPTSTATPSGDCRYCIDGDFAIEPTPVDPCPLCNDPQILVPTDVTPPEIQDVNVGRFCALYLFVDFKLDTPSEVWVSYEYLGGEEVASPHEEIEYQANLMIDLTEHEWAIFVTDFFYIHAMDLAGNHTQVGPLAMPEYESEC